MRIDGAEFVFNTVTNYIDGNFASNSQRIESVLDVISVAEDTVEATLELCWVNKQRA